MNHHIAAQDEEALWMYSSLARGKRFRVTAVFTSDTEANRHMEEHQDQGCYAVFGPFVIIAELEGRKL